MKIPERDPREQPLDREDLAPDPLEQFHRWLRKARARGGTEFPEAMSLATVGEDGMPQSRIVLLKAADERGFAFYTNLRSEKGRALDRHPFASLCFYWDALWRQVRVQGPARPIPDEEADAYFASRPRPSQIGAWASEQSRVLASRKVLDRRFREMEARFTGGEVPRPPQWGGYRVEPRRYEFWQGRTSRLHDRFRYRREDGGAWVVERLNP